VYGRVPGEAARDYHFTIVLRYEIGERRPSTHSSACYRPRPMAMPLSHPTRTGSSAVQPETCQPCDANGPPCPRQVLAKLSPFANLEQNDQAKQSTGIVAFWAANSTEPLLFLWTICLQPFLRVFTIVSELPLESRLTLWGIPLGKIGLSACHAIQDDQITRLQLAA
jgi:hypothetical protein